MTSPSPQPDWRPVPDPTELTTAAVNQVTTQYRRDVSALRELIETRLDAMDKAVTEAKGVSARVRSEMAEQIAHLRELNDTQLAGRDKAVELLASNVSIIPAEIGRAVDALRELLGARIDGMDIATKLLATQVAEVPTDTDKAINALKQIMAGEIENVRAVTQERFTAVEGTFASNALALTAALAAQKEAASEQNKSNTLAITKSEQATKETIAANAAQTTNSLISQAATISDLKDRLVRIESGGVATAIARTEQREVRGETRADRAGASQIAMMIIAAISVMIAIISLVALALKK